MKPIWRKLRAAMSIGLVWAGGWAAASVSLLALVFFVGDVPAGLPVWPLILNATFRAGVVGFISGAAFAGVLGAVHRRSTLGDLKPGRTGLLGVVTAFVAPVVVFGAAVIGGVASLSAELIGSAVLVYGILGLTSAAITIRIAKGPPKEDPSVRALRNAQMRGRLLCPQCGCLFGEDDVTCQNYPRGAFRRKCGFERSEAQRAFPREEAEPSYPGSRLAPISIE